MAAISTVLAIGSLVVAAGSAYESYAQGQKASRISQQSREVSLAENSARQNDTIRAQVRQERVKRAQILQASQNTGVSSSSGSLGGVSALSTEIGNNIGSVSRSDNSFSAVSAFGQAQADATNQASIFGQVSKLGQQGGAFFGSQAGAQADFAKWFNNGTVAKGTT